MLLPNGPLSDGEVTLRAWQPEDADWYVSACADPDIQRWTSEPRDLTADDVRRAIAEMHSTRAHAGMAVTDARTGQLLGNAGLARSAADPSVGEVSYWLALSGRGRGAATRAVRLLVGWAWRCGLRRVELVTHVDNVGSQRVAERAGFHRDGVLARHRVIHGVAWDVVLYSVTPPEARGV